MSSNKVKKGWDRTYEKNDENNWKRKQKEILQGGGQNNFDKVSFRKPIPKKKS